MSTHYCNHLIVQQVYFRTWTPNQAKEQKKCLGFLFYVFFLHFYDIFYDIFHV